jgi:hypothetical protein
MILRCLPQRQARILGIVLATPSLIGLRLENFSLADMPLDNPQARTCYHAAMMALIALLALSQQQSVSSCCTMTQEKSICQAERLAPCPINISGPGQRAHAAGRTQQWGIERTIQCRRRPGKHENIALGAACPWCDQTNRWHSQSMPLLGHFCCTIKRQLAAHVESALVEHTRVVHHVRGSDSSG